MLYVRVTYCNLRLIIINFNHTHTHPFHFQTTILYLTSLYKAACCDIFYNGDISSVCVPHAPKSQDFSATDVSGISNCRCPASPFDQYLANNALSYFRCRTLLKNTCLGFWTHDQDDNVGVVVPPELAARAEQLNNSGLGVWVWVNGKGSATAGGRSRVVDIEAYGGEMRALSGIQLLN